MLIELRNCAELRVVCNAVLQPRFSMTRVGEQLDTGQHVAEPGAAQILGTRFHSRQQIGHSRVLAVALLSLIKRPTLSSTHYFAESF